MRHALALTLLILGLFGLIPALGPSPAAAEPIRCAAFLHEQDGSWRSFYDADFVGPDGPVHVKAGEALSPAWKNPKGDIARALEELCEEPEY